MEFEEIGRPSAAVASSTFDRIGSAHHWLSRKDWSQREWEDHLGDRRIHAWLIRVDGDLAGMVELRADAGGDVEMITFGLDPAFIGKGLGGPALTLATQLAWGLETPDGTPAKRVWLHTNSLDHPHALPNYERRGFRIFRTETVQRELPG